MIFKWTKDVENTRHLELVGYEILTSAHGIWVRAKPKIVTKITDLLQILLTSGPHPFTTVEQLLGLISHAAIANRWLRVL